MIAAVVPLTLIVTVAAAILFIICRRTKTSIRTPQAIETPLSRADRSEYDEVVSQVPNLSTYANIPVISNTENAGNTGNSGYESLELQPQNHQYESLAKI